MFLLDGNLALVPALTDLAQRLLQQLNGYRLWWVEGKCLSGNLFGALLVIGQAGGDPFAPQLGHRLTLNLGNRGRRGKLKKTD